MDNDTPLSPDRNGQADRLPSGRFAPGNRAAKGCPTHRRMAELRSSMVAAATPEIVNGIMRRLALLAINENDVAAARVYLSYAVGAPPQAIELSNADGSPLGLNIAAIHAVILRALGDDHDARHKVARALLDLGGAGDDAEPAAGG